MPIGGAALVLGTALIVLVNELVETQAVHGNSSLASGTMLAFVPAAFFSGLLSFLSPCTLPILPAYFAFSFQAKRERATSMSLAFFLGLATTMTLLGASATAVGGILLQYIRQLTVMGGILIMMFGAMSLVGVGFAGLRIQIHPRATFAGSYLFGATFALGWTTCIGPILGALLTLLASQGLAVLQGAVLAFLYTLGLGIPLIVMSTLLRQLGADTTAWRAIRGWGCEVPVGRLTMRIHSTGAFSGLMFLTLGYMLASGQLASITELAASSRLSMIVLNLDERLQQLLGMS